MRDGYLVRWAGREYEAAPAGDEVRIYQPEPGEGFTEVRPGRYVRVVPLSETSDMAYVRTTCVWRGAPFVVLARHDDWVRLEYTGGRRPVAEQLGLEEFDFGVYQGWARSAEVTDVTEVRV